MPYLFRVCHLEMDYETYSRYVLTHHADLNLPYSFAVKLSFVASPLVLGRAMLVLDEEGYEPLGAFGVVYGTGARHYEDRHICQIELVYLASEYRCKPLFIQGLTRLLAEAKADNPDIDLVQFWAPMNDRGLDKLFARFRSLPGATATQVNDLMLHAVSYRELIAYCESFARMEQ